MWYDAGMDDLQRALSGLEEVRAHLARGAYFRGYRAGIVLLTALTGIAAALLQPLLAPYGGTRFVMLWFAVALVNITLAAAGVLAANARSGSAMARQQMLTVFATARPALLAGGIITFAIMFVRPDALALLPGLWCLVFAMGVFATLPYLPPALGWSGAWYVAAGAVLLAFADTPLPLSPWGMGIAFGGGQLIGALLFYCCLERNHDRHA